MAVGSGLFFSTNIEAAGKPPQTPKCLIQEKGDVSNAFKFERATRQATPRRAENVIGHSAGDQFRFRQKDKRRPQFENICMSKALESLIDFRKWKPSCLKLLSLVYVNKISNRYQRKH